MNAERLRGALRTRAGMIAIGAIQWLLLTTALGALVIHTDRSLEGLIGLHIEGGFAFLGAAIIGFLLGATVERTMALVPMTFFCCLGGALLYVALLYVPVWQGTLVGTTGLENFATTRALLYFGLAIVPISVGALAGRLLGPMLPGGDLLADPKERRNHDWWLVRTGATKDRPPKRTST
jgi:hypothetical protein